MGFLTRRRFLGGLGLGSLSLVALSVTGVATLSGCAGAQLDLVRADISREPIAELDPDVVRAISNFTATMINWRDQSNLICSPLSVLIALAMTRNGAAGSTATEMDAALELPAPEQLNPALNTIIQTLESRSGKRSRTSGKTSTVVLSLAQQLWGQQGMTWKPEFLAPLARFYGTGIAELDLTDPGGAARQVNNWVDHQTDGKITEIVDAQVLAGVLLVLANAMHLKAAWLEDFSRVGPGDFRSTGKTTSVEMMHASAGVTGYQGSGFVAVGVPYIGNELGMAVLLPDPGQEQTMINTLTAGGLADALAGLADRSVELTMPLFTIESSLDLQPRLKSLGMQTAFTPAADFSQMTAETALMISNVLHTAVIAVDEKGTEAAAATVVTMVPTSGRADKPLVVVCDRPFAYTIYDRTLRVPIMAGWVQQP